MKLLPERAVQVNFHLFQRTGEDARRDPLGKNNVCELYTHHGKSSESLVEDNHCRDIVQLCRLLTSFQEGPQQ